MGATHTIAPAGERLDSWKEISAYLKRNVRTLQRWEKNEGLPVHRHVHESQVSVYAYPSELDAWLASRTLLSNRNDSASGDKRGFWHGRLLWAGFAVATVFLIVGGFVVFRRSTSTTPAIRNFHQVWAADEVDYWNAVSPDGRYVSFTDIQTGDLSIRDLAQSRNRRLTNKGKTAEESRCPGLYRARVRQFWSGAYGSPPAQ